MLSLVTRSFRAPVTPRRNRARLALERLDGRYCPAGPVITNFTATVISGNTVCVSGTVTDPGSASISVSFSGPVGGTVSADGTNGNFSYTATASGSGTEQATATDDKAQVSPTVQTQIALDSGSGSGSGSGPGSGSGAGGTSGSGPGSGSGSGSPPASPISINLSILNAGRNLENLCGQVTDATPGGLTVTFSGVASGSTTTNADGTFNVNLPASAVGQVQASVTDGSGNTASASAMVTDQAPVIQNFYASQLGDGTWMLSGSVQYLSPGGLTVQFGGPSWLQGQSATVNTDGTFSLTIAPPAGQQVLISAQCTDWFGLQSNTASDTFQT